jgi:DNA-binding Xre family transcriptional regulator
MNLHLIKQSTASAGITLKELCAQIGMTYQNLNRCIRDNKITANYLEKISAVLDVPICIFFDDKRHPGCTLHKQEKDEQPEMDLDIGKILAELESYKMEKEYLKRENAMKDKIIGLLEAQKVH